MTPLRQRMIEDVQVRNLAPATQRNNVHYAEFAKYFDHNPELLDSEAIHQYLLHLLSHEELLLFFGTPAFAPPPAEATFYSHQFLQLFL